MTIRQKEIRKFLSRKIAKLNNIIADMDGLITELGFEYFRVCIFGSARIQSETPEYKLVRELAYELAKRRVDIVTGGGPGLMEAANIGSKDAHNDTRSIGLPIELPFESDANAHLDVKYHHRRFSSRLDEFMRISHAVIVTPGGIGTVLELFFTWQLLQVDHISNKPVILLGREFWSGLLEWMENAPLKQKLMNASDFDHLKIVDTVPEMMETLEPYISSFEATAAKKPKNLGS